MPRRKKTLIENVVVQLSPRMAASRANGRKGGLATAAKYGQEFRTERAERGGRKLKELYGSEYFEHIRSLIKNPGRKKTQSSVLTVPAVLGNGPTITA